MQWCWSGADSRTFSHAAAVACADSAWSAQLLLCAVYLYQLVPLTPELSAQPCSQHHGHSIAVQPPFSPCCALSAWVALQYLMWLVSLPCCILVVLLLRAAWDLPGPFVLIACRDLCG